MLVGCYLGLDNGIVERYGVPRSLRRRMGFCQWGLHVFAAFAQKFGTRIKARLFAWSFTVSRSHNWEYTEGGLDRYGSLLCQVDHRPRLWDAGVVGLFSTSYLVLEGQPHKHQFRLGQQEYSEYVCKMRPKPNEKFELGFLGANGRHGLSRPKLSKF